MGLIILSVLFQQVGGELIHLAVYSNQLEMIKKLIEKYDVDPTLASSQVRTESHDYMNTIIQYSYTAWYPTNTHCSLNGLC